MTKAIFLSTALLIALAGTAGAAGQPSYLGINPPPYLFAYGYGYGGFHGFGYHLAPRIVQNVVVNVDSGSPSSSYVSASDSYSSALTVDFDFNPSASCRKQGKVTVCYGY